MKVYDEATDDVVSTEGTPIVARGIGLRLRCRECDTVFEVDDAARWIPAGHKKHNHFKCPECDARVAKQKGTNRNYFEDYVGLSVDDAFARRLRDDDRDPDDYEAVPGSDVDPDEVGDSIVAVFEYYPHNGATNWLPIGEDDVYGPDDGAVPSIIRGDYHVVEWYDDHYKPVGYDPEWDEEEAADDPHSTDSYLRFVRRVDE